MTDELRRSLRRRPWRTLAIAAALVAAVAAAAGGIITVANRREARMAAASNAARAALLAARAAGASTWAPADLLNAEQASRDAAIARRVQELRLWPLPAADEVVAAFDRAERLARAAQRAADEARARASDVAAEQLAAANTLVTASETLAHRLRVGKERRSLLAEARLAVEAGRVYQREGDHRNATIHALRAKELVAKVRDHAASVVARYADPETVAQWRRWKEDTIAWSRREGRAAIVVCKEAHLLTLFVRGQAVATYPVDLGFNWTADKAREGDGATPEGRYRIVTKMGNPQSVYYKALRLDYPNADDRAEFSRARRDGTIPASSRIGGLIEIHGGGGRNQDWTSGCIALANRDMDDLFERVGVGTPVTIVGSDDYGAIAEFASQHRGNGDGRRP
ncbi:MAG TPA: L,D-transpeptidase [Vicinamibacterales bacterium]|nr:L,D-transpeptidase [Vicinamibacterales bacterium]HPW21258.1 L,D-transpeptidase [Vicinamibacterales bacterium]